MLNTLVYLPTILAYVFISLLISILTFIVVYICHKLYYIIYDNVATFYVDTDQRSEMNSHGPKGESLIDVQKDDNENWFKSSVLNTNIRGNPTVSRTNDGDAEIIWAPAVKI
ncbi:hypothetical protein ACFFRR_010146 [Megaselia abdita]